MTARMSMLVMLMSFQTRCRLFIYGHMKLLLQYSWILKDTSMQMSVVAADPPQGHFS